MKSVVYSTELCSVGEGFFKPAEFSQTRPRDRDMNISDSGLITF